MSIANLQDLADQFCAVVGLPPPGLVPDGNGLWAFSAKLRDVDVTLTHDPVHHPDHALVLVFFGPVPADRELAVLRELLHANLIMLQPGAPSFSRNPMTGDVVLQYVYPLAGASGQGLWAGLQAIVDSALKWRKNFFLDQPAFPSSPAAMIDAGHFV